jgi:hypothetical protein
MSYVITTITTRPSTTAKFIRDLESTDPLLVQATAVAELKKAAAGFTKRTVVLSVDKLTASTTDVWATAADQAAFYTANKAAVDAYTAATKAFNTAQGLTSVSTTVTV